MVIEILSEGTGVAQTVTYASLPSTAICKKKKVLRIIIREVVRHRAVCLHATHESNSTPTHELNPWNKRGSN